MGGVSRQTNINGLSISYNHDIATDAPVMILLHGFPLNKAMWAQHLQAVHQENFRLIAYDIRGHGDFESGTADFSIELFVDDLVCFMKTMGLEKVVLFGFSMGTYTALHSVGHFSGPFEARIPRGPQRNAGKPGGRKKRSVTMARILENGAEAYLAEILDKPCVPAYFVMHHPALANEVHCISENWA